ncbi:hypothetical protein MJD09_19785 [bacterium]|nr:hypothetical protein [bacterium]
MTTELTKRIKFSLAVRALFTVLSNSDFDATAQEKKGRDIPETQIPVEERDTGESLGETLGALPGRIVALPLRLVFTGIGKVTGLMDYNAVVLRVTDWLTERTERVKLVLSSFGHGRGVDPGSEQLCQTRHAPPHGWQLWDPNTILSILACRYGARNPARVLGHQVTRADSMRARC